ncbi:MAG: hypothetical protein II644_04400 [Paludibacteraceae bacterium]|nr:hypothetical protein [Paludibacteraceae bacterium]
MSNFENLKQNYSQYHAIKQNREMTPPVFFHEKAMAFCNKKNKDFLSDDHIQAIYAVLVAWGMHRSGEKGAKMPSYNIFKESILRNKDCIEKLRQYRIETISKETLNSILSCLTCLCFNIDATTRSSRIVSGSKTLAHILPDLVCPIDNLYTLTFFRDEIKKSKNEQEKFQFIITSMWDFFHNVPGTASIPIGGIFEGSYPKIFDNLIVSYRQEQIEKK